MNMDRMRIANEVNVVPVFDCAYLRVLALPMMKVHMPVN